jgi:hypothetical protein
MINKLTDRKKLFIVLFPVLVIAPLVVASFLIGAPSIWIWIGVGVGMIYLNHRLKKAEKEKNGHETKNN